MYTDKIFSFILPRGVTGKFFWGGKVIYPDFFPGVKCFFPDRKFPFWYTQKKFLAILKSKMQKKKIKNKKIKGPLPILELFPPFIFNYPFFFLPPFSIFSLPLFPGRSLCPLPPPVTPLIMPTNMTVTTLHLKYIWVDITRDDPE